MSYQCQVESLDIAKHELGETAKLKDALNELRELIAGEPSLDCPQDDEFLIKFLRGRKYDVSCAFNNVKKYFRTRMEYEEDFEGLTPHSIPFDTVCRKNRLVTISRKRDPEGRVAAMLNIGAWNEDICKLYDIMRTTIVHIEHLLFEQDAQINGVVFVVNVQGLSVYHLKHYTPSIVKKLVTITQDCFPLRIKGIYIVNNPAIFDVIFLLVKHFLKPKLVKRIRLFGYDLQELRYLVPDDLISEVHGGTHEAYDYDRMEPELLSHSRYFERMNTYGYRSGESVHL